MIKSICTSHVIEHADYLNRFRAKHKGFGLGCEQFQNLSKIGVEIELDYRLKKKIFGEVAHIVRTTVHFEGLSKLLERFSVY